MNHAITIGDVASVMLVVGGLAVILGLAVFAMWFFNPWRSGH
jgi:hypothetical protein